MADISRLALSATSRVGDGAPTYGFLVIAIGLLLFTLISGCASVSKQPVEVRVFPPQERREWVFPDQDVIFSNALESARLNDVERVGEDRYRLTISPEAAPINPSAWYGFEVRSSRTQTITLEFDYQHGWHRYWPKLSDDGGVTWRHAEAERFQTNGDAPELTVELDEVPLRIFAQPPIGPDDMRDWVRGLQSFVDTRESLVGYSVRNRPIEAFSFGSEDANAPILFLVGRQHPPEITGALAFMAFVEALMAETAEARRFRERVRVLAIPLLNPDGVIEGNWRGNANAVDLNRDWGPFNEPETRMVRDLLISNIGEGGGPLLFAIDFHSTFRDVLYTVEEDPSRAPGGLLMRWIEELDTRYPEGFEEEANEATSSVFKNWVFNTFGAPAVTYEVSDTTPPEQAVEMAGEAARILMELTLMTRPHHPEHENSMISGGYAVDILDSRAKTQRGKARKELE